MFDIDYILTPVDFSRSSRAALALARSLKSDQARLEIVHVVRPWPRYMQDVLFPYAPLGEDAPQIEHELLEAARAALEKFHHLDGKDGVEPVFMWGDEKSVLPEHTRSTAANLVVMGAFGEGGPRPDSLGSVSERMIRTAGAPVLLVRELDAHPTLSKVLVAVDLSEGSKRVLGTAIGVAQAAGADLEIIHVVPDPLADDPGQVLAQSIKYEPRKVLGRGRDRIEALFERLMRDLEPAFAEERQVAKLVRRRKIATGDPAAQIATYAVEIGADLVVVGARNPARAEVATLGRVASAVARRCPTHVMVVPVPGVARLTEDD